MERVTVRTQAYLARCICPVLSISSLEPYLEDVFLNQCLQAIYGLLFCDFVQVLFKSFCSFQPLHSLCSQFSFVLCEESLPVLKLFRQVHYQSVKNHSLLTLSVSLIIRQTSAPLIPFRMDNSQLFSLPLNNFPMFLQIPITLRIASHCL